MAGVETTWSTLLCECCVGLTWCWGRSLGGWGWAKPSGDEAAFLWARRSCSWWLKVFGWLGQWFYLSSRWSCPASCCCCGRRRRGCGHRWWLWEWLGRDWWLWSAGTGAAGGGPTGRDNGGLRAWWGTLTVGWTRGTIALTARLQVLQETADITTGLLRDFE